MASTTLPRSAEAGAADAATRLQQILDDPTKAKMLVIGESPGVDGALKTCREAAEVKASIRHTVWIPDASVLSNAQRALLVQSGKVAVAVGLSGNVVKTLTQIEAEQDIFVDIAFLEAEIQ